MSLEKKTRRKVVVIGFDGFTWKTLDYLKNELRMPNLDRLRGEAAWGRLESTLPSITVPAWISFATGANPGKHGVFNFIKASKSAKDNVLMSSKDIKIDTIQQIIRRNGLSSILINLHGSTPALTDDITIGSFTSATADLFNPKELADDQDFRDYPAYGCEVITLKDKHAFIADLNRQLEIRTRVAKKLFEKRPDFFFLLFSESDHLQHAVYDQIKKGSLNSGLKEEILRVYQKLDDALGWFMDNAGEDTYIILMSDHGFENYQYVFNPNNYLESLGLLKFSNVTTQQLGIRRQQDNRFAINLKPLVGFLRNSRTGRRMMDIMRGAFLSLQNRLDISRFVTLTGFMMQADKDASRAFCTETGLISVNRKSRYSEGIVDDDEATEIRNTLIARLRAEKSPRTGKNPFLSVIAAEDIYHGPYVEQGPDIILEPGDHGIGNIGYFGSIYSKSVKNFHDRYGIYAIRGPGVKAGRLHDMHIMDIAPTVLHILGLAVPSHMDGKVMADAFMNGALEPVRFSKGGRMDARAAVLKLARSGALFWPRKQDVSGTITKTKITHPES